MMFRRFRASCTYRRLKWLVLVLICVALLRMPDLLPPPEQLQFWDQRNMEVVVHLDMKGAPPKLEYLRQLLPRLRDAGASGLLLEYEDTFCFKGDLAATNAKHCHDQAQLLKFLEDATKQSFTIIPMLQTLGKLESLLEVEVYANLSEPDTLDQICPSNREALQVLEQRFKQVLEFHRGVHPLQLVHIGLDALPLARCHLCNKRRAPPQTIFLEHLQNMADFFSLEYPEVKVLIWAETFSLISLPDILNTNLPSNIIPVLRNYDATFGISDLKGYRVQHKFSELWVSSAFKGVDHLDSTPNLLERYQNNYQWLRFILDYKRIRARNDTQIGGVILSGLGRLNHRSPLLELLPCAVPALLLALLVARLAAAGAGPANSNPGLDFSTSVLSHSDLYFFYSHVDKHITRILNCNTNLDIFIKDADNLANCSFYEKDIYEALYRGSLPDNRIMEKYFSTDIIQNIDDEKFAQA